MPEVRPAILEENFEEVKKRIEQVRPFVKRVHIDIMDGEFVPNTTFNEPEKLEGIDIEIVPHLMVRHPVFEIKKWDLPNVKEIIVHFEAIQNLDEVVSAAKTIDKKIGIAINPSTSTYDIKDNLDKFSMVLVMGVEPGFSGQAFNNDVLEKIRILKEINPDMPVEVDGGVDMTTKDQILRAGADILSANSAIFKADNIEEAIKELSS
ncbi:MAG: ribulose-phosphate 3-epimerase [Patescibacteria group bacterium]